MKKQCHCGQATGDHRLCKIIGQRFGGTKTIGLPPTTTTRKSPSDLKRHKKSAVFRRGRSIAAEVIYE